MATSMTDARAWSGLDVLLAWVDFYGKDSGGSAQTFHWSGYTLADPSTYYGGEKEARVIRYGTITQGLSDRNAELMINSTSFTLSDVPDISGNMLLRG